MKVLINAKEIEEIVQKIADDINRDYAGKEFILIYVREGAKTFLDDLLPKLKVPFVVDSIKASSYEGTESTGRVSIKEDIKINILGRHVLVVEDIVDTGRTMNVLIPHLLLKSPLSLKIVAFLSKPLRREIEVEIGYLGKEIPNEFVVGHGFDFNGQFRELPDVVVFEGEK